MTQAQSLQSQLRSRGLNATVTRMRSGHLHVGCGTYSLTITQPERPISIDNIIANARRA